MQDRERRHFLPANCNNQLITVIEKGRIVLLEPKVFLEKFPPKQQKPKTLQEILGIEK